MKQAIGHWTGDPLVSAAPPATPLPYACRTRRWSFKVGNAGIAFSSVTESHGQLPPAVPRERWRGVPLAVAAVAGGLALLLAGATAGRAWSSDRVQPEPPMAVPAAIPFAASTKASRPAHGSSRPARVTPVASISPSGDTPAFIGLRRTEAVELALKTGEFQEWTNADGTTGFAVAGPAEASGATTCRALAVLARQADGKDAVTSSKVCQPAAPPAR